MAAEGYAEAIRLINEERPDLLVRVPYHPTESAEERFGHVEELAIDPTVHLRAAMIDPGTVTFSFFDRDTATIRGDHTVTVSNAHFRHCMEQCERLGLQTAIVVREPGHVRLTVAALGRAGCTARCSCTSTCRTTPCGVCRRRSTPTPSTPTWCPTTWPSPGRRTPTGPTTGR